MNSSNGFASKTLRCFDTRKGAISNLHIKESCKKMYKAQIGEDLDEDSLFEYVDNNVPGPGYYHNESTASSIRFKNIHE